MGRDMWQKRGATTPNIKTAATKNFIKAMEEGVRFSILQLCNTNTRILQALIVQAEPPPVPLYSDDVNWIWWYF